MYVGEEQVPIDKADCMTAKLGKGEKLNFRLQLKNKENQQYMDAAYNVMLQYRTKSKEEKTYYYLLKKQCVSGADDFRPLMKEMLQNK